MTTTPPIEQHGQKSVGRRKEKKTRAHCHSSPCSPRSTVTVRAQFELSWSYIFGFFYINEKCVVVDARKFAQIFSVQPNRVRINFWTCSVDLTTFVFGRSFVLIFILLRRCTIASVLFSIKIFESLRVQAYVQVASRSTQKLFAQRFVWPFFSSFFTFLGKFTYFASCKHVFSARFLSCFVSMHILAHHFAMWCALVPFSHKPNGSACDFRQAKRCTMNAHLHLDQGRNGEGGEEPTEIKLPTLLTVEM